MRPILVTAVALALVAAGCSDTGSDASTAPESGEAKLTVGEDDRTLSAGSEGDTLTPVLVSLVGGDTAAVRGSDGRYHVVYELSLTNAASAPTSLEAVEALDGTEVLRIESEEMIEDEALRTLDRQPAEDASLSPNEARVLLLTASFESEDDVPDALERERAAARQHHRGIPERVAVERCRPRRTAETEVSL